MMQEPPAKRIRQEGEQALALYDAGGVSNDATDEMLQPSIPTQRLYGHKGSIYALEYAPDGQTLASGSFDKTVLLWSTGGSSNEDPNDPYYNYQSNDSANNSYKNYNQLAGHKNAVLDLTWSNDSQNIVTASADKMVFVWDAILGTRVKKLKGHGGVVNAVDCCKSINCIGSASDDCTVKIWDARQKKAVATLTHDYQVTSVAFSLDGSNVYSAGIDNDIFAWDVRQVDAEMPIMSMKGHKDTVTCLKMSPNGNYLLSNSMDGAIKMWDVRPFVEGDNRESKVFVGSKHSAERGLLKCAWSAHGDMVTGGSSDQVVHIWDELTTEELYYLPGHDGCVNSVVFHPKEHVIASGSSDKTIYVGELSN
uniref:Anaphase-promoting complex subunit 4 WD40 domain-containing protein n=1 Tax=Leptocylindrus danicus TaxID=163516 RepID=A0A7S2NWW5_9STRA|mmetsp:Transcript_15451/g.22824  ORF Transcript_15451/g.22824 Transcript_15451/m.22824 type:complete len:365 (+) Transcript_15451:45-1139(+)